MDHTVLPANNISAVYIVGYLYSTLCEKLIIKSIVHEKMFLSHIALVICCLFRFISVVYCVLAVIFL